MTTEPDLGETSRALLSAAREGLGPDAATIARMRGNIDAAVAAAPAPPSGIALGVKLGLVGIVAVVVGAGVLALQRSGDRQDATNLEPPPAIVDTPRRTPRAVAPPSRIEPAVAPTSAAPAAKPRTDRDSTVRAAERRRPVATRPARRIADLGREVELVDRAMDALQRGDFSAALAAVREHAVETARHGQLAEDAAAIEIEALCRRGDRAVARAKRAAFDRRWPRSAQRARLATACR